MKVVQYGVIKNIMYSGEKALSRLKLNKSTIQKIKREVHDEFPNDKMMYELHLLRVANAIKKGYYLSSKKPPLKKALAS